VFAVLEEAGLTMIFPLIYTVSPGLCEDKPSCGVVCPNNSVNEIKNIMVFCNISFLSKIELKVRKNPEVNRPK
jgi:hypothetical protein